MKTTTVILAALPTAIFAQTADYSGKYQPCVDYYTVGESTCRPRASTPVLAPAAPAQPQKPPSPQSSATQMPDPVSEYLQNYGKPPREFVEFYLNPTQENALKWVATYNQMMQRSQALSRAWSQADVLYAQMQGSGQVPQALGSQGLPPVADLGVPLAQDSLARPASSPTLLVPPEAGAPQAAAPKAEVRLGAFAENAPHGSLGEPAHITYYFSATCPFCAKMTPALNKLYKELEGKLILTCVDVTPLSVTHRPSADNMLGKLPCNWRLPEEGEVERESIQQTPTMLVRHGSGQVTRLSGFVPLEQFKSYLSRR